MTQALYTHVNVIGDLRITGTRMDYGVQFYDGEITVPRDSGTIDSIPVSIPSNALPHGGAPLRNPVRLQGELRTYKMPDSSGQLHRVSYIYASSVTTSPTLNYCNIAVVVGYIKRQPVSRVTPLGRYLTEVCICVPRPRGEKYDHITCLVWGKIGGQIFESMQSGDLVQLRGRVQTREYKNSKGSSMKMTEVSISNFRQIG